MSVLIPKPVRVQATTALVPIRKAAAPREEIIERTTEDSRRKYFLHYVQATQQHQHETNAAQDNTAICTYGRVPPVYGLRCRPVERQPAFQQLNKRTPGGAGCRVVSDSPRNRAQRLLQRHRNPDAATSRDWLCFSRTVCTNSNMPNPTGHTSSPLPLVRVAAAANTSARPIFWV